MHHVPTYMTVKQAAMWIEEKRGRRPSIPTIYRWILKGVRGHRLASTFIGGVRLISATDLEAFFHACNGFVATESASPVVLATTDCNAQRRSSYREQQVKANGEFLRSQLRGRA
jgi:hypothetical protein